MQTEGIQRQNKKGIGQPLNNNSPPRQESIQWENIWANLSRNSIDTMAFNFQDKLSRRRDLLSTNPLEYPIFELISQPQDPNQEEFKPFNRLLKPYQAEENNNCFCVQNGGIPACWRFQMGVGKTLVMIEFLLQNLARNSKGKALIVLPKSAGEYYDQ